VLPNSCDSSVDREERKRAAKGWGFGAKHGVTIGDCT
jgi:hypothetical protein